jgi:hypothetical protein
MKDEWGGSRGVGSGGRRSLVVVGVSYLRTRGVAGMERGEGRNCSWSKTRGETQQSEIKAKPSILNLSNGKIDVVLSSEDT